MKNILIIEDDESIRKMIASVLEIEGYSISAAANGKQALETIQNGALPDIILLDMMMPVMNGWDFLDFVRANATTSKIPIIVVSAYAEIAKSVKPNAVVPKPVQLKSLLKAIEGLAA
ncbi:MAG: response regulator [Bdellovibrionia bacterium]